MLSKKEVNDVLVRFIKLNNDLVDNDEINLDYDSTVSDLEECLFWGKAKQVQGYTISKENSYGGEGQGDQYWMVVSILDKKTKEKTLVKFDGWYDSWAGREWNGGFELVEPYEVVKIEYRSIKNE